MQGSWGNLKLCGPRIGYKIFVRKRETKDWNIKWKLTAHENYQNRHILEKKRIFYNKMDTKF